MPRISKAKSTEQVKRLKELDEVNRVREILAKDGEKVLDPERLRSLQDGAEVLYRLGIIVLSEGAASFELSPAGTLLAYIIGREVPAVMVHELAKMKAATNPADN